MNSDVELVLRQAGGEPGVRHVLAVVYRKAADALEQVGWCRHRARNDDGAMCTGWAVAMTSATTILPRSSFILASWDDSVLPSLRDLAILVLNAWVGERIEFWNDKPQRTRDEVTKTLHALADYLDNPNEGGVPM